MAAHSDVYPPRCYCTTRTARSRTSGENLFDFLFMAQSSRRNEPSQIPGRFTEFIANALAQWAQSKGIAMQHIQPGKPTQNAYVERFNKTYHIEELDCYLFDNLHEVRDMTADWLHRYNHHRPHEALGRISPVEYRVKLLSNLYF